MMGPGPMRFSLLRWPGGIGAALAVLWLVLVAVSSVPATAQISTPAPATPAAAEPETAPSATAPSTVDQLRSLVSTLQDDAAREALVQQLQALIAAQQATAPAPGDGDDQARPDTVGARVLAYAGERAVALSREMARVADVVAALPAAADWAARQATDAAARDRWTQLGAALALILASSGVCALAVGWALARPRRAIAHRAPRSPLLRLPLLLLHAFVELVPVAAFAVAAYAVLSALEPPQRVWLAALAVVNASIGVQVTLLVARIVLAPYAPAIRATRMNTATAVHLYAWARRLVLVGFYGYFLTEAAYVLGLPLGAYAAIMKLLGGAFAVLVIAAILTNRQAVADWLSEHPLSGNGKAGHGEGEHGVEDHGVAESGDALRSARRRMADLWHVAAILYVLVTYGVWVLNVYGGFEYLARATLVSLVIAVAARVVVNGLDRGLRRVLALPSGVPNLEVRLLRYLPLLHRILKAVIWAAALMAILNAWGVDSLAWLDTDLGRRVLGSAITIALIVVIAVAAWELVSGLVEFYLTETDREGMVIERSARARTLLPLLRNALLIVLITVVGLVTLSELGVNIAPLLAGAGVVGLAVGFGSQTLVKDVITGLFILFEDTIAVGDVVDVGGGHAGVVEAISIRTIRLRDLSGSVHSVPFSAVTTVKNLTKDFSFALFRVSVDYSEDPDHVIDVLKGIGSGMQAEPAYRADILAPLEVMGLDELADSGIVIQARFKTRPGKQWTVAREFNRRMKKRFNELGISIPYPHMQLVVKDGSGDRALGEALSQGS